MSNDCAQKVPDSLDRAHVVRACIVVAFFVAVAVAGLYLLWGGQGGNISYRDMACSFEDRPAGCVDSVPGWNEGLSFYDFTLSVTGDTLQSLKSLLWDFWGIEFAGAGEAAVSRESILPLQVLQLKMSGCMGLSWLALMVAEARNIELHAVLLPGHVFLKYGQAARENVQNLEPNRKGFAYTDEEYREKYKAGPWTGLEFRPLSAREFIGLGAFDMGNLYLQSDAARALKWYRGAESLFPEYPGIAENQKVAKNLLF